MSAGFRLLDAPGGAKVVVWEEGKGVRASKTADAKQAAICFRCRKQIGRDRPFHEVNGQLVHAACTKEF